MKTSPRQLTVEHINPFIVSTRKLFKTMLKCDIQRGEAAIVKEPGSPMAITALVGLTGPIQGCVGVSLPVSTALAITARMLETPWKIVDDTVLDAAGEIANMIVGGAKPSFIGPDEPPVQAGLPTIIRGSDYSLHHPTRSLWLDIPFVSELGPFSLRVALQEGASEAPPPP